MVVIYVHTGNAPNEPHSGAVGLSISNAATFTSCNTPEGGLCTLTDVNEDLIPAGRDLVLVAELSHLRGKVLI